MNDDARHSRQPRGSARLCHTTNYAFVLVVAGGVLLVGTYIALPYILNYPLAATNASEASSHFASRSEILSALVRISIASGIPGVLLRVSGVILAVLAVIGIGARRSRQSRVSARLRLTASYALFLVVAGGVLLVGIYLVLRYVPNYPLTAANPPAEIASTRRLDHRIHLTGGEANSYVASRQEILDALVRVSGILLAGLAVIGIGGGWILAGRILRPLQRINEAAEIASTGRLDHRIHLTGRNDEFRQLADTFDYMLDRLHDAFSAHERFAANASHELRTPLSITATLLDVARRDPSEQDYSTLIERLSVTNARAIGLTEAILRLADANSVSATFEPVDLAEITQSAIDEIDEEAEACQVTIHSSLDSAEILGDSALVEQLVSNLIQNAIRHNHSSGAAWISMRSDHLGGTVGFRVENTGDVISAENAARFVEPFFRGAGRISHNPRVKGYGLGLALVARIAEIHGGSLSILPRHNGGLIVKVKLPAQRRVRGRTSSTRLRQNRDQMSQFGGAFDDFDGPQSGDFGPSNSNENLGQIRKNHSGIFV